MGASLRTRTRRAWQQSCRVALVPDVLDNNPVELCSNSWRHRSRRNIFRWCAAVDNNLVELCSNSWRQWSRRNIFHITAPLGSVHVFFREIAVSCCKLAPAHAVACSLPVWENGQSKIRTLLYGLNEQFFELDEQCFVWIFILPISLLVFSTCLWTILSCNTYSKLFN
jgi:hypothetical protein